jgi:uncharacterized protein
MHYLITGGTGFIGKNLVNSLLQDGHQETILSRKKGKINQKSTIVQSLLEISLDEKIDHIINLAGEPIANKKWSQKQKEILINSRLEVTKKIIELISKLKHKPSTLISASAIGFYGSQQDEELDENSPSKIEFTNQLCKIWEEKALEANKYNVRTCIARFGVVLGKKGGALAKMLPAFKFGLGGKIGNGNQFMSWVHLEDVVLAIKFLIDNPKVSGVFNLTSPNPVRNSEFTKILAKTLQRPAFFDMPNLVIKILFGEMGETLLASGQKVMPRNLLSAGFEFKFKNLEEALKNICCK